MDYGFGNKQVLVYGLGVTGRGTAKALLDAGCKVVCWDDKIAADEQDLPLLNPKDVVWEKLAAVVKSPGVPMDVPVVKEALARGIAVVGDMDLLWRRERGNGVIFLGITGTNGKSTTTALVGHVLKNAGKKVAVGGNIGEAALTLPELPEGGFYVLEMSSYQLEMMAELAVDGAVLTNITPDHLGRHGTMENYLNTKLKLFDLAKAGAMQVVGVDQPELRTVAEERGCVRVSVGGLGDYEVRDGAVWSGGKKVLSLRDFPALQGPHNAQNMACALALLVPRWLTLAEFVAGVKTFKSLPHRMEDVGAVDGVRFVNDSKATNGDSAQYALESFENIYWICGGQVKSDGLGACVEHLDHVRAAFVIGEAQATFVPELERHQVTAFACGTLDRAVQEAFAAARTEGLRRPVVLLSPAAASWDQFRSFEHRGDVFANAVKSLASEYGRGVGVERRGMAI